MTVSKLTEGLALVAAGIRIPEDTDASEKQAATTTKVLTRTSAYYEEILKETRSLSCHISVLHFFKSSSETRKSPPVLLTVGQWKWCSRWLASSSGGSASSYLNCNFTFSKLFISMNIFFPWSKTNRLESLSPYSHCVSGNTCLD